MDHDATRRALITTITGLTVASIALISSPAPGTIRVSPGGGALVAYFSRSGNTRVIAGVIQRSLQAALFEIEPAVPYPADYFKTVEQARKERDRDIMPALKSHLARVDDYDTLYLGFPVWGNTIPPVVRSFLSTHRLENKQLIPFITHGGYGTGDSLEVLAGLVATGRMGQPLVIECDQERRTTETVVSWLSGEHSRKA